MELLVVMSMISIISGITFVNVTSYKKIENKIDYNNTSILIISFMNNAKLECKVMKKMGRIYIPEAGSAISFKVDGIVRNEFKLPAGFKIKQLKLPSNNNYISINSLGYSYDAGTIIYIDREKIEHTITMTVGQDYAEIKS